MSRLHAFMRLGPLADPINRAGLYLALGLVAAIALGSC